MLDTSHVNMSAVPRHVGLILDGNGHVNAELYYQKYIGAPFSKVSAHKISYLLATREVLFAGARSLESN